jgi:hypothetical protein
MFQDMVSIKLKNLIKIVRVVFEKIAILFLARLMATSSGARMFIFTEHESNSFNRSSANDALLLTCTQVDRRAEGETAL